MNATRLLAVITLLAPWCSSNAAEPAQSAMADTQQPQSAANGEKPMVTNPMRGKEPMPGEMKREGMVKEDVRKQALKKDAMMREMMKQEEMKK